MIYSQSAIILGRIEDKPKTEKRESRVRAGSAVKGVALRARTGTAPCAQPLAPGATQKVQIGPRVCVF